MVVPPFLYDFCPTLSLWLFSKQWCTAVRLNRFCFSTCHTHTHTHTHTHCLSVSLNTHSRLMPHESVMYDMSKDAGTQKLVCARLHMNNKTLGKLQHTYVTSSYTYVTSSYTYVLVCARLHMNNKTIGSCFIHAAPGNNRRIQCMSRHARGLCFPNMSLIRL